MERYPGHFLPDEVELPESLRSMLLRDYEIFSREGLPLKLEEYVLDAYGVDVESCYGCMRIKNPFGKASGQLSCNYRQVEADGEAGLGFVVLKTAIAQDELANSSMKEWKVKAPRMSVEEIVGKNGRKGYTVAWKGRGWDKSFGEYLEFMEKSLGIGNEYNMLVVPSCKYHLPDFGEDYNQDEYRYTTIELLNTWKKVMGHKVMPLEKDFSPTLSGSDKSKDREAVLDWLSKVPGNIKSWCGEGELCLGLKLMNTMLGESFQIKMLEAVLDGNSGADFIVAFNRLFSPEKEYGGKLGVAFGGWDLSDRNLAVLSRYRELEYREEVPEGRLQLSATGNIQSGLLMAEYGLRGCANGQLHTYFQIPLHNFGMKTGSRSARAVNELFFNPVKGLVASMLYLRNKYGINDKDGIISWKDIYTLYKRDNIFKVFGLRSVVCSDWEL